MNEVIEKAINAWLALQPQKPSKATLDLIREGLRRHLAACAEQQVEVNYLTLRQVCIEIAAEPKIYREMFAAEPSPYEPARSYQQYVAPITTMQ